MDQVQPRKKGVIVTVSIEKETESGNGTYSAKSEVIPFDGSPTNFGLCVFRLGHEVLRMAIHGEQSRRPGIDIKPLAN